MRNADGVTSICRFEYYRARQHGNWRQSSYAIPKDMCLGLSLWLEITPSTPSFYQPPCVSNLARADSPVGPQRIALFY